MADRVSSAAVSVPAAGSEGVFRDVALLLVTNAENERFVPAILRTLQQFWPGHPECIVVTNGAYDADPVIRTGGATVTGILDEAVQKLRRDRPNLRHVFLLQDVFCPLAPVDNSMVAAAMESVRAHDLKYVLFQWPGDFSKALDPESGPVIRGAGLELTPIRSNWETVNSLAPAVWNLDHLASVAGHKAAEGYDSLRLFEQPSQTGEALHYMQMEAWPVVGGGFLSDGQINPKAVSRKEFPSSPLLSQLRVEYCGVDSAKAARRKYDLGKIAGWFKRGSERRRRWKEIAAREPSAGPSDVFHDTVLLVSTYSKNEHYIPAVLHTVDRMWPGHPECFVATDGDLDAPNTLRFPGRSFVEILGDAARRIKQDRPDTRFVFLMLEDLCPLGPVNTPMIEAAVTKARTQGLKYVLFPWHGDFTWTYDRTAGPTFFGPDMELVPMRRDWEAPNSLVAALWDIDHLIWMAEQKLEAGIHDPWRFEFELPGNPHVHYIQVNGWPTVCDGFMVRGKLNDLAPADPDFPPTAIMSQLRKQYCGVDNQIIARLKYGLKTLSEAIKARLARKPAKDTKVTETAKPAGDL